MHHLWSALKALLNETGIVDPSGVMRQLAKLLAKAQLPAYLDTCNHVASYQLLEDLLSLESWVP